MTALFGNFHRIMNYSMRLHASPLEFELSQGHLLPVIRSFDELASRNSIDIYTRSNQQLTIVYVVVGMSTAHRYISDTILFGA
eukprot:scaffold630_cov399-Prasinococcus_capsulatus_cf.AAC.31